MLALGSCISRVVVQLLVWMCNLVKLTEMHMLEINFSDRKEGLTVSCIICDH